MSGRTAISSPENRQVRRRPSAVRRRRLQLSQKWSETPAMKPMVPGAPGACQYRAGP